jgi:hypothetical protein
MLCKDCQFLDKEYQVCSKKPSELDDIICLLRNVVWNINLLEDEEEGEEWKQ